MTQFDFSIVRAFLENRIKMGRLPGAVFAVGSKDQVYTIQAVGYAQVYPERRNMCVDTLFDLASLTKVVATLPSVLLLLEHGEINLDQRIVHYLPEWNGPGKGDVTVRQLLTHSSGLPASVDLVHSDCGVDPVCNQIFRVPLLYKPDSRVVYSDVGFMLLGILIEQLSKLSLNRFTKQYVFVPLHMRDTQYNPDPALQSRTAATEYRKRLDRYQCAEVHDENASVLGGISGHAGLFSTVSDLIQYATCLLQNGAYGNRQFLESETIHRAYTLQTTGLQERRGLGWGIYQPMDGSFGGFFDTTGYGHTGFTGTSLYMNPGKDLFVVLLTNRVHFGRTDDILSIRKGVHRVIAQSL